MGIYSPSVVGLSNPYKFSAYSTVAQNTGNGAFAKTNFATEEFDTGSNYDTATSTFTAPVAGFYQFDWHVGMAGTLTLLIVSLFKNNAEFKRGADIRGITAAQVGGGGSCLIQLAASDAMDVRCYGSAATAIDVVQPNCYFMGSLVSKT